MDGLDTSSIPVVFTTQTPYAIPSQKFMIPSGWKRFQLSQLINKALSLPRPIPFDFLVQGNLLHASLAAWCSEHGVGEEETLHIEYIQSVLPPQKVSELPHEDWVSSVSCKITGYLLTASYDGHIRTFDYSQNRVAQYCAHKGPITCLHVIPSVNTAPGDYMIATASHDLTAQLSQLQISDQSATCKPLASLHLHTAPVSSICGNGSGTHILTSSWDTLIGVFDQTIPENDEVSTETSLGPNDRKKRRKANPEEGEGHPKKKAPKIVLKSHTARVSKVVFDGNASAISAGFDSTVRCWSVENGICTGTITSSEKPFLDLVSPSRETALAAATDRTITLFDLRSSSASTSALSLRQLSTPSCLAVSPYYGSAAQQVASGGYDGIARIWDLRSTKEAVAVFNAWNGDGEKKILGLDWNHDVILIGGENGTNVWRISESTFP